MSIQNDPAAKEDVLVDLEVTGICRLVDHDEEIVFFLLETSMLLSALKVKLQPVERMLSSSCTLI